MVLNCCICTDLLVARAGSANTQQPCVTPCGHLFHFVCVSGWLAQKPSSTCPECRQPLRVRQLTKVYPKLATDARARRVVSEGMPTVGAEGTTATTTTTTNVAQTMAADYEKCIATMKESIAEHNGALRRDDEHFKKINDTLLSMQASLQSDTDTAERRTLLRGHLLMMQRIAQVGVHVLQRQCRDLERTLYPKIQPCHIDGLSKRVVAGLPMRMPQWTMQHMENNAVRKCFVCSGTIQGTVPCIGNVPCCVACFNGVSKCDQLLT